MPCIVFGLYFGLEMTHTQNQHFRSVVLHQLDTQRHLANKQYNPIITDQIILEGCVPTTMIHEYIIP